MIEDCKHLRTWQNLAAAMSLSICGLVSTSQAQRTTVPFVAGFERFARHQEMDAVQAGQLLLTELNCTACHAAASVELKPKLGPRLNGAGNRLEQQWMANFLADPQQEKPGTTMPDLLASLPDNDRRNAAEALAAFLGSLQEPFPEIKGSGAQGVPYEFWKHGDEAQGQQLYHQVGCVACHEADESYETAETKPSPLDQLLEQLDEDELKELGLSTAARRIQSVPHSNLPTKYSRQSLTFFLLDPHRTRTGGRMPNLKLGVVEAADIATWLLRNQTVERDDLNELSTELTAQGLRGRQLFSELGCASCHAIKDVPRGKMAKPLPELDFGSSRSCLTVPQKGLPNFNLDQTQTETLKAAVTAESKSATKAAVVVEKQLNLLMLKLNCLACHERNGQGGVGRYRRPYFETVGHVDIGDEGRLPPPLTGAGRKLQSAWLTRVLHGTGDVRPHMRIRMPIFPVEQVKPLPGLLVKADSESAKQPTEKDVFGDVSKLAEAGRQLLDTGCVQCHPLRGDALPGVVGIDLEGIASRVHPQWFRDFLFNPGSLKPRTRMPTFFPSGKSQNAAILSGDTEQQIAAMWTYLKNINKLELPPKIERARSQDYELVPQNRPIVLRTFMEEAGTHAIAVGFSERVHFAFDAEQVRLANAWRGRFLDAQGTWFVRFAPPAEPLGEQQIEFPPGVPFALFEGSVIEGNGIPNPSFDAKDAGYRFLGYRLDKSGVPTFLSRFDRFDIDDRVKPDAERTLIRQLTITDRTPQEPPASIWFRAHFGKSLKQNSPLSYTSDAGLTVSVSNSVGDAGELQTLKDGTQLLILVKVERRKTIEVRYSW
ncbi:MAG: cytochrome oxidase [Rhodopirellula sp.]|nr:cytochrome oxidase [Rhodopirellula sp.]